MEQLITGFYEQLPSLVIFVIIAALLYVLAKGADILVDEAVSLSIHWGVPKMIVGATIVSLGTTLPEVTISVLAALNGNPDIALGNAIGSIIANTALILGLAAVIGIVPVDKKTINRQGLVQLGVCALLAIMTIPLLSGGNGGSITQWMGFLLIGILAIYTYYSMKWAKTSGVDEGADLKEERAPVILQMLKLFLGVVMVIASSRLLIPAVEVTAVRIGIPDSIIAATLIAFGTSLPELVTAVTAVRKGHGELAIGNVVGANILNVLFVVGASAAVTKAGLGVPADFYKLQIPVMLLAILVFTYFAKNKKSVISKFEGLMLFSIYAVYLLINFVVL